MPNPNPKQTEDFKAKQFKPSTDVEGEELAKEPICVKLPKNLDAIVRPQPKRSEWIRAAIVAQLRREGRL